MAKKKTIDDEADADVLQVMLADPEQGEKQAIRKKLSALLGRGALPCPVCGEPPHAMLRRPAVNGNLPVYEVACLAHGKPARGDEPSAAVHRWNANVGGG